MLTRNIVFQVYLQLLNTLNGDERVILGNMPGVIVEL